MKLVPVDPKDIPNFRESHRGRVSYPILKTFLETNEPLVKLDRTGMQQSFQALYSSLTAYIRSHNLPVKLFSRQGDLYLARTDMDDDGNLIENWQEKADPEANAGPATPITSVEVAERFEAERNQTAK
jgi:hypothetical protein